jgi:hypothetical protein
MMVWMLRPTVVYVMEAITIARHLHAQGLVVNHHQAMELAHARLGPARYWVQDEPQLSEDGRAALERIARRREAANETWNWPAPEADNPGRLTSADPIELHGGKNRRGDTATHQHDEDPDRIAKKDPIQDMLKYEPPDEEWS